MVARNPVSSSTVTQLLMMENQWIWVDGCGWVDGCVGAWVWVWVWVGEGAANGNAI